jgi:tetratricopeptide (TPR) repeat protein
MRPNQTYLTLIVSLMSLLLVVTVIPMVAQSDDGTLYTPFLSDTQASSGNDSKEAAAQEQTALDLHDQAMILAATAWDKPEVEKAEILRRAIDLLTLVINKDPSFVSAYVNRGTFYRNVGEIDLALADYDRSISIKPTAGAYRNKASLLQSQGQLKAALDHYEQALSSFRISTETFVDAARDLENLRAAQHDERAATDLLYTSSVVSTIECVVALRTQLGRPLTQELSLPAHLRQKEDPASGQQTIHDS